jgi:hypothetical protein
MARALMDVLSEDGGRMTNIIGKSVLGASLLLAASALGCGGSAWQMRRGGWSGELALRGPMVDAEYAAQQSILAHCGGRARIVHGAEAERAALADAASVAPHEVSIDRTGRRVHYVCVSRAPAAFRTPHDTSGPVRADVRLTRGGL